jgi:hypothetical protein
MKKVQKHDLGPPINADKKLFSISVDRCSSAARYILAFSAQTGEDVVQRT